MFWLLLISILLTFILVSFVSIPWAEKKVLFCPSKKEVWTPDVPYHDVYIDVNNPSKVCSFRDKNKNEKKNKNKNYIHGWHFNNFEGKNTIMFCHGNSGNISHRRYIADICEKFELNLFIFDYRGFGKSSSVPSKTNIRKDGEVAYKYLRNYCEIKPNKIIMWGESLGGISAIWVASKYKCRSLVLLSTFSGLDDAITHQFKDGAGKSLAAGLMGLVSLRFDLLPNKEYIKNVKCPVVIMHSPEDDIIPYRCGKILYNNIKHKSKVFIQIQGYHSSPVITEEQLNRLFMFCDVPLSKYRKTCNIKKILRDIETVAERYHNFID